MLFHITWRRYDDKKLEGAREDIRIVEKWHTVGEREGVCICETDNASALVSWMSGWESMWEEKEYLSVKQIIK